MDRKQVKTFRMGAEECEVLELLGAEGGQGRTEVLRGLIADGLRWRMTRNEPPVHRYFVETLTDEAMVPAYLDFCDAVRDRAGLPGRDGAESRFHFVKVPRVGKWKDACPEGGWAVLPKTMRFTKTGYEQDI